MVVKDSVVFSGGLGVSVVETRKKVDGKTLFHVSSITKMFTALGILKLVEEKKLHLQDKLRDLAPEVPYQNAWEATHPVRVVNLLEHSTGFDDVHLNQVYNATATDLTGLAAVNLYRSSLATRWKPGLASSYASPNYTILGYLLEKYSGQPWSQYMHQAVLSPLGMQHSDVNLRIRDEQPYARGYRFADGTYISFPFFVPAGNGAAGALHTCANDMTRYLRFLLNHGQTNGRPWLAPKYLDTMETIHSTAAARAGLQVGYALGNLTFYRHPKADFRGHTGLGDGFASLVNYDRRRGVGYAIANNGGRGMWRISVLIEDFLTKDFPAIAPGVTGRQTTPPVPEAYLGYYTPVNVWSEQWGFLQRLTGGLRLTTQGQGKLLLKPLLGPADTLEWVEGTLFRARQEHQASVVLGSTDDGTAFLQAHNTHQYYEQTSYLPILMQQILLGLSGLAMGLAVVGLAGWPLLVGFKRVGRNLLLLGLLPGLAVSAGLLAFRVLTVTDYENRVAFNSINFTSLTIFWASLGFGVLAIAGLVLLIRQWSQLPQAWLRGVLAFTSFFLVYLTIMFLVHGWIGLRVWAL
ncbi:beta-lactamase family protein [Hymenobacter cellulosivorans]|uniref:Beta-lactamase family protein n=2 Tax=Hymenobacter cellulosivorans TaxID=2932249 RepID=A0ABY4FID9_9BACT|nr:beta-lactamase family protein [Hymenobacter cellulosivorans]